MYVSREEREIDNIKEKLSILKEKIDNLEEESKALKRRISLLERLRMVLR